MGLEAYLGAVWGIYCLIHYSRSKQKIDGAMTRRDSIYLVITLIFVGLIF